LTRQSTMGDPQIQAHQRWSPMVNEPLLVVVGGP
jgi:hypothetical protein